MLAQERFHMVNTDCARHVTRHVVAPPPVTQRRLDFEHRRPRVLREMLGEATGVFFYVFPGMRQLQGSGLNRT